MQIGDLSRTNPQFIGPPDGDGVILIIYELFTFDKSFRTGKAYWEFNVSSVEAMTQWPVKAESEPGLDVRTIRGHLSRWVRERRTVRCIKHFSEPANPLEVPKMSEETDQSMWFDEAEGRLDAVGAQGEARLADVHYIDWMRPPREKVSIDYYVPTLALKEESKTSMV